MQPKNSILTATATFANVFTVPSGKTGVIKGWSVDNPSSTPTLVDIYKYDGTTAYPYVSNLLVGADTITLPDNVYLEAGWSIRVKASVADLVTIDINWMEV